MPGVKLGWPPKRAHVISIGNDVALVRAVIHALGQRVGDPELEAVGKTAVPSDLQRIVHGIGYVIRFPNGTETFIRPQSIEVFASVSRIGHKSRGRLVDV